MTEAIPRKRSMNFFNPFRQKQPASRSNSTTASLSEFTIEEVQITDGQKTPRPTNKLRKRSAPPPSNRKPSLNQSRQARNASLPATTLAEGWERDAQTGERKDHTELLHSLAHRESAESLTEKMKVLWTGIPPQPASVFLLRFPPHVWPRVVAALPLADAASLAFSSKSFLDLVGSSVWAALDGNENHDAKIDFLRRLDGDLPDHLLCFPCATYHVRTQKGQEMLRPTNISNPLFNCPNAFNPEKRVSRTRLTVGRSLPFPFVQLILRAHNYSPAHGIPIDSMSRRYKDRDGEWTHQTRFAVVNGHLLLRVISSAFATPALPPAGLRKLLYSPNDNFNPFFSVCAHWRDGDLMPAVKCALSHIPKPPEGGGVVGMTDKIKYRMHPPNPLITLCSVCRPMRRCPECASEYLIEMRMQEDKNDPSKLFKHAIVLTRWSDLGDGSSPQSPEWAACNGQVEYDSFKALGKRAISGIFESQFTVDQIPGQKIISMNQSKEKRGEAGHNWY